MPPSDDPPRFEEWIRSVTFNPAAPVEDPGKVSPANRRWLRRFFDAQGPASKGVVNAAFLAHQVALANDAVAAVLKDLRCATSLRPEVVVDIWMGNGIRISIDDGYTAPSMWSVERAEAFAEVANYFQEQLDQTPDGVWPVCKKHDVGLHAEVHEGTAVWQCRPGRHTIAAIGALGD